VPNNNDLANHYHFAIPFYEALRHGDLYQGIFAAPNFGYGDVVVRFYPPALYYLMAAGRFVTGSWYARQSVGNHIRICSGSLGAYFWARCYVREISPSPAHYFMRLMPYHLAEFYQPPNWPSSPRALVALCAGIHKTSLRLTAAGATPPD